ncbi:MAG: alpha-2-macroglobulin, partial [Victivallales bacterium]|nr:alpha-2-macroglobulin [Victivallales bacterium]
AQSEKVSPELAYHAQQAFAQFLYQQFGVQTMRRYSWFFRPRDDEGGPRTFDLHTLTVDETICQLATGIQRLRLPDEFSYIRLYEKLAAGKAGGVNVNATRTLATIHENRRQYDIAVTYWERYAKFGANYAKQAKQRIQQIVGNWGQFENVQSQPAGRPATVDFRFRNGKSVEFTAHRIDMDKVLEDVMLHVKSKPKRLDWSKVNIGRIGHRLVYENQTKYIAEQVAQWTLDLKPRANHFDRRITVTTPLRKGGVYLLVGKMKDGNTTRILMQLDTMVVARKQLDGKVMYYVADATTGAPVKAKLSFFGWRMERIPKTKNFKFLIKEFVDRVDADGQLVLGKERLPTGYQWLVAAISGEKLAWHDLSSFHFGRRHDPDYKQVKTFVITDRPVYRPEHKVQWKAWVRHAQYDMEDASQFAGQTIWVEIRNAKNEKLYGATQVADEYGGVKGELKLKGEAALGVYRIILKRGSEKGRHVGNGTFRVEEYKKPEFEVTVEAPTEPIMLGEKIEAKVTAKYYFGAPVTEATVKVKVMRSAHDARWFPAAPWDWFYGIGYWWFGYDYDWYPGWERWGCSRPVFWWWHRPSPPPELVSEIEVEIGEDGTVAIPIDTTLAKLMHGDLDHRYDITAEVRDRSRRTIVGTGKVLVAREPFKVYAWTNRGYYRVGQTIRASFQARRLDGKAVAGKGKLTLFKVTYANRKPREREVQSWDLGTNDEGFAEKKLKARRGGQYRLSYTVTDSEGHDIEGGHVFVVRGEGFDGGDYRFNHIELVPDRKEYHPGEGIELMVNTDRVGSTVLLFVRPTNGIYLPPKTLRLKGKSMVVTLKVTKKDMPNFFVEAMTIADGKLHTDIREIVVPPEKRVLTVDVAPNKSRYKPGEEGTAQIRLTDEMGNPFVGSVVVTVYDKSVEYIS